MMTLEKHLLRLLPLTLVIGGLLAYNFINAQWAGPTATPPNNNTPAPINIGGTYQAKLGDLGAVRMRAGEYCDENGENCFTSDQVGGGGGGGSTVTVGGKCFEPAYLVTCNWNWSGDGNDNGEYITYASPEAKCAEVGRSHIKHSIILAQCQSSYTYTYTWTTSAWGYCSPISECSSSGRQSRLVGCRRSDGTAAANSLCTGTPPVTTQNCNSYVGGSCR